MTFYTQSLACILHEHEGLYNRHKWVKYIVSQVLKRKAWSSRVLTCNSSSSTQQSSGKSCSMGTRNWRQPFQWARMRIMQSRLMTRRSMPAILKNYSSEWAHVLPVVRKKLGEHQPTFKYPKQRYFTYMYHRLVFRTHLNEAPSSGQARNTELPCYALCKLYHNAGKNFLFLLSFVERMEHLSVQSVPFQVLKQISLRTITHRKSCNFFLFFISS